MQTARLITAMTLMLTTAGAAWAGPRYAPDRDGPFLDRAQVLSSTPIYESINEPRRECWTEEVPGYYERASERSYSGAVLGGIVGGLLGKSVGRGSGRTAATIAGAATGAIVGDNIDNDGHRGPVYREPRVVERCRSVDNWTQRVTGYNVRYLYQGHEYGTVLPYEPGATLRVRVNVSVAEGGGRWPD